MNQIPTKPKILVVEDEPILQLVNSALLTRMGCEVVIAKNGNSAIAQFFQDWDLILVDQVLPDMSGLEVCRKRRAYEKRFNLRTPMLAYSVAKVNTVSHYNVTGIDGFSNKRVDTATLYALLQYWLPLFNIKSCEV